jgi:hypothetical protein
MYTAAVKENLKLPLLVLALKKGGGTLLYHKHPMNKLFLLKTMRNWLDF